MGAPKWNSFHFIVTRGLLDNSQTKRVMHCIIRGLVNSAKCFTENRDYIIAVKRFVKIRCRRFDESTNYPVRKFTKSELISWPIVQIGNRTIQITLSHIHSVQIVLSTRRAEY